MATKFSDIEKGEKELRRDWPHETGLEAGEQKQEGRTSNLVVQEGSKVLSRYKELL